jgi:hypothetical protein
VGEIRQLTTRQTEVQDSVVELLENALEVAKRGELVGVTVVGVMPDGAAFTASSSSYALPAMIGALVVAQHRLLEGRLTQ